MKRYLQIILFIALNVLPIRALAQTHETYSFNNLNQVVPDGGWPGIIHAQAVTSSVARLESVQVNLNVAGEFNGDLYAYLRHVSPTVTNFCVLLNRPGRSATLPYGYSDTGLDVAFDDVTPNGNIHNYQQITQPFRGSPLTGRWQPDGRQIDPSAVLDTTPVGTGLSSFNGVDASGTWTLFLADVDMGATNMLVSWELKLTGASVPAITWATPVDITYGTALDSSQLCASAGTVGGTFAYDPPAGTVLQAGSHTLQVVFTPADSATYLAATTSVTINVLQKDLTIMAQDVTKGYNGLAFNGGTVVYAGLVNGETASVLGGSLTFSGTSQGAINAGSYAITPGGLTSANYAITFLDGTLVINPAPLTVRANNAGKIYDALPYHGGNGVTFEGFVNGESADALSGTLGYSGNSQGAVDAGSYAIVPGGLTNANYAITFAEGTLTIGKAASAGMLAASANPAKPGEPVTFTMTLAAVAPGAGTPTGVAEFLIGVSPPAPANILDGVASYTASSLAVGEYSVYARYAGDQNFFGVTNQLTPELLINTSPIAQTDIIKRSGTNGVKVAVSSLLSNDSDADGDLITFLGVSATSTNQAALTLHGDWVLYIPPAGSLDDDLFTYTISDGRGSPVTGSVLVQVVTNLTPTLNLIIVDQGNGSYLLRFSGIPGITYRIEYCDDLIGGVWTSLGSGTTDSAGQLEFLDTPPGGTPHGYYRSAYP